SLRRTPLVVRERSFISLKGFNDSEIFHLVELAHKYPLVLRFIELMPTENNLLEQKQRFLSSTEVKKKIEEKFQLQLQKRGANAGPAEEYLLCGTDSKIGFISSISCKFCSTCNRIRISAKGKLRNCLFDFKEYDIRPFLQNEKQQTQLELMIRKSLWCKPEGQQLNQGNYGNTRSLSQFGG
ncbi:hypothetical protein ACFL35_17930, partial [Candidatus Riflebacteria bacterium]